jgi:hypothetical protein
VDNVVHAANWFPAMFMAVLWIIRPYQVIVLMVALSGQ